MAEGEIFKRYDSTSLMGFMEQLAAVPDYWLSLCFPTEMRFEDEYIEFEKLSRTRKLAPFVVPTSQGVPIYSEGSQVTRLKPAYIKPRDAVTASRQIKRKPGELVQREPRTPAQRWNAAIADIQREHREAIERRWEWMAARAVIDGGVTIRGDNYPERYVDFNRDPSQNVVLANDERWSNPDADIPAQLTDMRNNSRRLSFGGGQNRLTLGPDATGMFLDNNKVKKQLDTETRGTQANLNTGVREGADIEFLGRLGTLDCYAYNDYFEDENGDAIEILDPKYAMLTGDVAGVRAFGAILDKRAGLRAQPIFPKMWDEEDPSATYCMSQSAPLMVPTMPNRSTRIQVAD